MLGISLIITRLKNLIITEIQDYHNLKDSKNNLTIDINKYKSIKEFFGIDFIVISPDENNQYLHYLSGYDEEKSKYIAYAAFFALALLLFLSLNYIIWMILIPVIIRFKHPPTMNDRIELDPTRRKLAWCSFLIFITCFSPMPLYTS